MSILTPEEPFALGVCPHCGAAMPEPTEQDRYLAGTAMGWAWSEEVGATTTGFHHFRDCGGCGAKLYGVEYLFVDDLSGRACRTVWHPTPAAG